MPVTSNWQTVTPTLSNITLGNGSVQARVRRVDGQFQFILSFIMGSSTVVNTGAGFSISIEAFQAMTWIPSSVGRAYPVSAIARTADATGWGSGTAHCSLSAGEGAVNTIEMLVVFNTSKMSGTVPFTWATGDYLVIGNAIESFDN